MNSEWKQLVDMVRELKNPNDRHTMLAWVKRIEIFEKTNEVGHFAMVEIKNGRNVVDAIELAMYEWDL
jgi:hypothetical protein